MADQRSRGGKKEGTQNPQQNSEKHQGVTATTAQPEKANQTADRPRPGDRQQDQHGDRK